MAVPVVLYGSETWVLSKREKNRIRASEMRFLKAVKVCTREVRLKNKDVRRELGREDENLQHSSLSHTVGDAFCLYTAAILV